MTLHEDRGQFGGTLLEMKGSWFTRVSAGTSTEQQVLEARGTASPLAAPGPGWELLPDA